MPPLSRWTMTLPLAIACLSPALVAPAVADPAATPSPRAEPVVSLFCYMVTTDGQVRDLSSLCGDTSETAVAPRQAVAQNQNGEVCYFLDSNGKPCTVAGRPAAGN
ncbi:hypothetical protein [Nodosilinea nodulosa]|uniref:hypothetical protein n=1 Tax=Nodosilinea nodulosa TaxID=416001 RepID=UPI0002E0BB1F|nr:hypothetical protein [Nodosilinea nodulosa]